MALQPAALDFTLRKHPVISIQGSTTLARWTLAPSVMSYCGSQVYKLHSRCGKGGLELLVGLFTLLGRLWFFWPSSALHNIFFEMYVARVTASTKYKLFYSCTDRLYISPIFCLLEHASSNFSCSAVACCKTSLWRIFLPHCLYLILHIVLRNMQRYLWVMNLFTRGNCNTLCKL